MDTTYEAKDNNAVKAEAKAPEGAERIENRRVYMPAVDVIENEKESVLFADMPGVDQANIDITIEKNVLTIKGKPTYPEFSGYEPVYSEYGIGDFKRSFTLSDAVDKDNISATVKDGVLTLRLPKASPKTRKISVANAEA
jgi:Molecular chaperone (small heat shock protein)